MYGDSCPFIPRRGPPDDQKYPVSEIPPSALTLSPCNVPRGEFLASIWRDFLVAVFSAPRKRDEQAVAEERRRAIERLADETIRENRRATDPPE